MLANPHKTMVLNHITGGEMFPAVALAAAREDCSFASFPTTAEAALRQADGRTGAAEEDDWRKSGTKPWSPTGTCFNTAIDWAHIDLWDMTHPFHYDNAWSDGGHYGKDGGVTLVDDMLVQVIMYWVRSGYGGGGPAGIAAMEGVGDE